MSLFGNGGKGDAKRPTQVDEQTFSDNWERIFAAKKDYYASVRKQNYADSLRLEGLVGRSSTVEQGSLKSSDVRSNRTAPATSGTAPHEVAANAGRVEGRGPIYLNAETGEQVDESWWPGDEINLGQTG